ncbi:hypothetical protein D9757_003839 [Collybiopsis confluens]|uniref:Uncharacterized protein n=1 Tax=Collybiopsis confluens TaxID=2823264 RepID=A0A8H5HUW6_9AGAR|nr:hypothetical protein D9757_003839 [Collybiopsis confluens]
MLGRTEWDGVQAVGVRDVCTETKFPNIVLSSKQEFLFYHQKESDVEDDPLTPITPWAQLLRREPRTSNSARAVESERLVKQTYSVHVYLPADRARGIVRKWHLTAYFSQEKLSWLRTIDSVEGIGNVAAPDGLFRSARANKTRRDSEVSLPGPTAVPESAIRSYPSPHAGAAGYTAYYSTPASPIFPSPPSRSIQAPTNSVSTHNPLFQAEQLVPLHYLQQSMPPRRDPLDEQLLRRFSATSSRGFN